MKRQAPPPTIYGPGRPAQAKGKMFRSSETGTSPPPTRYGPGGTAQAKGDVSRSAVRGHSPPPTKYGPGKSAQAKPSAATAGSRAPLPPPTRFGAATVVQNKPATLWKRGSHRVIQKMDQSGSGTGDYDRRYDEIIEALCAVSGSGIVIEVVNAAKLIDKHAEEISVSNNPQVAVLSLTGFKPSTGFTGESASAIRDRAQAVLVLWNCVPGDGSRAALFFSLARSNDPCLAARLNRITEEAAKLQFGLNQDALEDVTNYSGDLVQHILTAVDNYEKMTKEELNIDGWQVFLAPRYDTWVALTRTD